MSAPTLADHLVLVAADPVLASQLFVAGLVAVVTCLRYAQHLPTDGCAAGESRRAPAGQALTLPVAGMDETGMCVAGTMHWLHMHCDEQLTCYHLGARSEIWTVHAGTAMHGICNSHLLRYQEETGKCEKEPDGWAVHMQWLLH